jgi:hypothetical protein
VTAVGSVSNHASDIDHLGEKESVVVCETMKMNFPVAVENSEFHSRPFRTAPLNKRYVSDH